MCIGGCCVYVGFKIYCNGRTMLGLQIFVTFVISQLNSIQNSLFSTQHLGHRPTTIVFCTCVLKKEQAKYGAYVGSLPCIQRFFDGHKANFIIYHYNVLIFLSTIEQSLSPKSIC